MGDVSEIQVVGMLSGEPDFQYTAGGTELCRFSIPTHRKYKDEEETTWHRITVFGNQATACHNWLKKGSIVRVRGRLSPNEHGNPRIWENQQGEPRSSYEIVAERVDFLSNLREASRDSVGGSQEFTAGGSDASPEPPW